MVGSPQYRAYRITSRLYADCGRILRVVVRISVPRVVRCKCWIGEPLTATKSQSEHQQSGTGSLSSPRVASCRLRLSTVIGNRREGRRQRRGSLGAARDVFSVGLATVNARVRTGTVGSPSSLSEIEAPPRDMRRPAGGHARTGGSSLVVVSR